MWQSGWFSKIQNANNINFFWNKVHAKLCCWQIYKQNKYVVIYTHMCTTYLSMAHSSLLRGSWWCATKILLPFLTLYGKSILNSESESVSCVHVCMARITCAQPSILAGYTPDHWWRIPLNNVLGMMMRLPPYYLCFHSHWLSSRLETRITTKQLMMHGGWSTKIRNNSIKTQYVTRFAKRGLPHTSNSCIFFKGRSSWL